MAVAKSGGVAGSGKAVSSFTDLSLLAKILSLLLLLVAVMVKKQSRGNRNSSLHAILGDEIEKPRAYYADVDAFELLVEVAPRCDSA
ncbi:hypothetical protein Ancab_006151 [Ancistrocladus abbreviatus]